MYHMFDVTKTRGVNITVLVTEPTSLITFINLSSIQQQQIERFKLSNPKLLWNITYQNVCLHPGRLLIQLTDQMKLHRQVS